MNSLSRSDCIPGTILSREKMSGATGKDFLKKVFYITDGIMLSQIREISGIDGTTLQNWVKRGWVKNPNKKAYNMEHLARILLINMMRDTMQLGKIMSVLAYINGKSPEDEIIRESELYGYVCRILDEVSDPMSPGINGIDAFADDILVDFEEKMPGSKRRLKNGIKMIVVAHYGTVIKAMVEDMMTELGIVLE